MGLLEIVQRQRSARVVFRQNAIENVQCPAFVTSLLAQSAMNHADQSRDVT